MLGYLAIEGGFYAAPSEWPPKQLPLIASALSRELKNDPAPAAKPSRPVRSVDEVAERIEQRQNRDAREREDYERATEPLRKAKKRMRTPGIMADNAPAAPTAERAVKAGAHMRQDAVRAYHCEDSPIERLATRRALDPDDAGRNEALRLAAARYYEHWYLSGMSPIGAIDLDRGSVASGTRPAGMPATELALMHRRKFREALKVLGDEFRLVVDAVVLQEQDIETTGFAVARYKNRKQVAAIAMDRLCCGLERLRTHFKIGRLDAGRPTMHLARHESQMRSDGGKPRALSRHRSLSDM